MATNPFPAAPRPPARADLPPELARLAAGVAVLGMPACLISTDETIVMINDAYCATTGKARSQVEGKKLREVVTTDAYEIARPNLIRALQSGEAVQFHRPWTDPHGGSHWILVSYYPERDQAGKVIGLLAVMTDSRLLEEMTQDTIERGRVLRKLTDSAGLPIMYFDAKLTMRLANQPLFDWVSRTEGEVIGKGIEAIFGEEAAAFYRPLAERALAGEAITVTTLSRARVGEQRHIEISFYPDRRGDGSVHGVLVLAFDVEEHFRLRQEISSRELQLKVLTDSIGLPLSYIDAEYKFRFYNKTGTEWTGLAENFIVGKTVDEAFPGEVMAWVRPFLDRALAGTPQVYERLAAWPGRGQRWIRGHMMPDRRPDGSVAGVYVVLIDIHDDVMMRESLEQQERRLRLFTDNIPEAIVYLDTEGRYRFVNNTFLQQRGKARHEVIGKSFREVLKPEVVEQAAPYVERALAGETNVYERLATFADGSKRWIRNRSVPDIAANGKVQGIYIAGIDIHDIKMSGESLKASEAELRAAMDSLPYPMAYMDRGGRYRMVNKSLEVAFGKTREQLIDKDLREVFGEHRVAEVEPMWQRALRGETVTIERQLLNGEAEQRWMLVRYTPRLDEQGQVIGFYTAAADIDDLKRKELELRHANWLLSSHFENTPLAVIEWDVDFRVRRWSPQAEKIFGWREEEILGKRFSDQEFVAEQDVAQVDELMARLVSGAEQRITCLNRNHRKDGRLIWCEWYNSTLSDDNGKVLSILSLAQDVTARILSEERLVHQASHDSLTGLPNRTMLQDRLRQAITRARRSGCRVAALFVDLDRFKEVNDTLGHRIGDELLRDVARRLADMVRESDLLVRLSGDEFMVVLEQVYELDAPRLVAAKLIEEIARPSYVEGHEIHVSASIGISLFPDDAEDVETLLKNADMAMYHAKSLGKNTFEVFSPVLAERGSNMRLMENSIRAAINQTEFEVRYQPIVDMKSGRIVGAEALLRWQHPTRGLVMPGDFIPLAEETGLIHEIGHFVLERVFEQTQAWRRAGFDDLRVAVNFSAGQFRDAHLLERVRERVRRTGCDPRAIIVEVTETGMLRDPDGVGQTLSSLRADGFGVAIDDFGTGFSSLSHLKRFPIDTLKVDRSFVADILIDKGDAAIVSAVLAMARALDIRVVAEGVEREEQRLRLAEMGCDAWQGFLLSPALQAADFEKLLRERRAG